MRWNFKPRWIHFLLAAVFSLLGGKVFAEANGAAKSGPDSVVVGKPAPNFSLPNQDGKETQLTAFRGKWVVLYFYPKDFTGGCTLEAHNFQKDIAEYSKRNAVILGVSVDAVGSHRDFCTKEGLNFKLLSDTSKTVCLRYGSLRNLMGIKIAARNTFVIDPQGNVAKIFFAVKPGSHSQELLTALDGLQKPKEPAQNL